MAILKISVFFWVGHFEFEKKNLLHSHENQSRFIGKQRLVKILIKPNVTTLFDPCQTFCTLVYLCIWNFVDVSRMLPESEFFGIPVWKSDDFSFFDLRLWFLPSSVVKALEAEAMASWTSAPSGALILRGAWIVKMPSDE